MAEWYEQQQAGGTPPPAAPSWTQPGAGGTGPAPVGAPYAPPPLAPDGLPPAAWAPAPAYPPQAGYPAQPGYPPPVGAPIGYGYPYGYAPARPQLDKGARTSLIIGIVGIFVCGFLFGPAAIIEGVKARGRIRQSQGTLTGDGLALAGIIVGSVVTALSLLGILILVASA